MWAATIREQIAGWVGNPALTFVLVCVGLCWLVWKRITVLHAFIKKTQQTPDRELKLARKRLKELE